MLDMYEKIISQMRKAYNSETLAEDKKLLEEGGNGVNKIFGLLYRVANKRIIEMQWTLVKMAQSMVKDFANGKTLMEVIREERSEDRDEIFDNKEGRVFYVRKLMSYIRPLSYLLSEKQV